MYSVITSYEGPFTILSSGISLVYSGHASEEYIAKSDLSEFKREVEDCKTELSKKDNSD